MLCAVYTRFALVCKTTRVYLVRHTINTTKRHRTKIRRRTCAQVHFSTAALRDLARLCVCIDLTSHATHIYIPFAASSSPREHTCHTFCADAGPSIWVRDRITRPPRIYTYGIRVYYIYSDRTPFSLVSVLARDYRRMRCAEIDLLARG